MNKPTQEQINQILEFIDSNTDKYEHDKELVKLTWQKAQDEILNKIDNRFEGHKCMERWEWNEFKKVLRNRKEKKNEIK
jgi:hypothetical protein